MDFSDLKDLLEILFFLHRWWKERQDEKRPKAKGKPAKRKPRAKKRK